MDLRAVLLAVPLDVQAFVVGPDDHDVLDLGGVLRAGHLHEFFLRLPTIGAVGAPDRHVRRRAVQDILDVDFHAPDTGFSSFLGRFDGFQTIFWILGRDVYDCDRFIIGAGQTTAGAGFAAFLLARCDLFLEVALMAWRIEVQGPVRIPAVGDAIGLSGRHQAELTRKRGKPPQ